MAGNHNEIEKRLWAAADELRANPLKNNRVDQALRRSCGGRQVRSALVSSESSTRSCREAECASGR